MKSKITNYFIIIGIIVFVIGFYFWFFKAGLGIPYQDPTPEMIRKQMLYYNFGNSIMPAGAILLIIGVVVKMFIKICIRLKKK